jgi:hypothetical protein
MNKIIRLFGRKGKDMKRIIFFVFTGIFLFAGCQSENKKKPEATALKLPSDIAGVWQAEGSSWQIIISQDGKVSSAILPLGEVEVKPNQDTIVEMQDGGKSIYAAGDFEVNYDPSNRNLEVAIKMENIHLAFPDGAIDGNSTDIFSGKVSESGKTWDTIWFTTFDYGPKFPQDPNATGEPLRFYKK